MDPMSRVVIMCTVFYVLYVSRSTIIQEASAHDFAPDCPASLTPDVAKQLLDTLCPISERLAQKPWLETQRACAKFNVTLGECVHQLSCLADQQQEDTALAQAAFSALDLTASLYADCESELSECGKSEELEILMSSCPDLGVFFKGKQGSYQGEGEGEGSKSGYDESSYGAPPAVDCNLIMDHVGEIGERAKDFLLPFW